MNYLRPPPGHNPVPRVRGPSIVHDFSNYVYIMNLHVNLMNETTWGLLGIKDELICHKRVMLDSHMKLHKHAVAVFNKEEDAIATALRCNDTILYGQPLTVVHVKTFLAHMMQEERRMQEREPFYSQSTTLFVSHIKDPYIGPQGESCLRSVLSMFGPPRRFRYAAPTTDRPRPGLFVDFNYLSEAIAAIIAIDELPSPESGMTFSAHLVTPFRMQFYIFWAHSQRFNISQRPSIQMTRHENDERTYPNVVFDFSCYIVIQNLNMDVGDFDEIWKALEIPDELVVSKTVTFDYHLHHCYRAVVRLTDPHEALDTAVRLQDKVLFGKTIRVLHLLLFFDVINKLEVLSIFWDNEYIHSNSIFLYHPNTQHIPTYTSTFLREVFSPFGTITAVEFHPKHSTQLHVTPLARIEYKFLSEAVAAEFILNGNPSAFNGENYVLIMEKNMFSETSAMRKRVVQVGGLLAQDFAFDEN